MKRSRRIWMIEGYDGFEKIYSKKCLLGDFSEKQMEWVNKFQNELKGIEFSLWEE